MEETRIDNKVLIENNPAGKRPLGKARLRWEDCVATDVGRIEAEIQQWRDATENKDRWRNIYLEGWLVLKAVTTKRRKTNI